MDYPHLGFRLVLQSQESVKLLIQLQLNQSSADSQCWSLPSAPAALLRELAERDVISFLSDWQSTLGLWTSHYPIGEF